MKQLAVLALAITLAGCAGPDSRGDGAGERAIAAAAGLRVPATAADGEIDATELPAYLAAQQKALRKALQPAVDSGLLRVGAGRDGSARVQLADAAFDPQSAQLRPQALLPLTALADTLQRDRASVLHVVAFDPVDASLAERRALAAAAVLVADGAAVTRVRAESRRSSRDSRVVFVFTPVVAGRGVRAWMPPADE